MSALQDFLSFKLAKRSEEGLQRNLSVTNGLIDFCSNDYLGFARSPQLFKNIQKKTESLTPRLNGATGSRLLSGNQEYTEQVEKKLAGFFHAEAALLFNSGYTANLSVLSSIAQKEDIIFYDELSHASIKDGARLSLAARHPFRHNDVNDLERKLARAKADKKIIVIESIYSMDGDEAPLTEIVNLAESFNAMIVLDEAHSTGVVGRSGKGLACARNLENKIDIRIHTFGKALGVHGASVVGSRKLTDYLVNFARPFIYTTALPPHSVAAIDAALNFLDTEAHLQPLLQSRIDFFLRNIKTNNRSNSTSAIQTAIFADNNNVKRIAEKLQSRGFDIRPILSPTVPAGSERLRICLHTYNSEEEICKLTAELNQHS